jgi:glucose-6-phosphate isomerase
MDQLQLWNRYQQYLWHDEALDVSLDISRMNFGDNFLADMEPRIQRAFAAMDELERGAVANPDENRMVGHYWLRAPHLAPGQLDDDIERVLEDIKNFAAQVHDGDISPERGGLFTHLLIIGIGGSALGPQFVANALSHPDRDRMEPFFFDNTDPDGMSRTLARIGDKLQNTLTIVISKSGGTPETRNGMLEAQASYHEMGLHFGRHAVAITGTAARSTRWPTTNAGWRASDVGLGRRAHQRAVGGGAFAGRTARLRHRYHAARRRSDGRAHARPETRNNPAALLALMWYHATEGRGKKDMVILPYKDRLELFARYPTAACMESLGKEKDLQGNVVHQGIAVYGNKGSTDQHAYVQQLREGVLNFFVTFIEVLRDREGEPLEVEEGVTIGDYLAGFLQGTRRALHDNDRESITITIRK